MALVPHRRKERRSHCEALTPASQTVGGCQLAEVQERLHQARLNITDYFHYCDDTSCRPQHVTGYPLKKIWDEARDLRWTLASATEPPDEETCFHDDPPFDYLGNGPTQEEREQWRREVGAQSNQVCNLAARLRDQYRIEGNEEPPYEQKIGGKIEEAWQTFDAEVEYLDQRAWASVRQ